MGYFHIKIHSDSRDLTTTLTPAGLRKYTRLPMGLTDSASVFQRLIHQALANCEGAIVYIDDIIVHGPDEEAHDKRLNAVLKALEEHDFRIQPSKCYFRRSEIPAFGHIVSKDGITPDPQNLKPILEAQKPKKLQEVQRFLGMLNYFQEFMPDFASLAEPLSLNQKR